MTPVDEEYKAIGDKLIGKGFELQIHRQYQSRDIETYYIFRRFIEIRWYNEAYQAIFESINNRPKQLRSRHAYTLISFIHALDAGEARLLTEEEIKVLCID
jgi:hypothetical protein